MQVIAKRARALLDLLARQNTPLSYLINHDPDLKRKFSEYSRVTHTIELCSNLSPDHRHIMFLGTYSSGKSSLINALLGKQVRKMDWDRTDIDMTMIGHRDNLEWFLRPEGRRLNVQAVESETLRKAFFFDTPGSGDISLASDEIRTSFAAADIFVYVFTFRMLGREDMVSPLQTMTEDFPSTPRCVVFTQFDAISDKYGDVSSPDAVSERDRLINSVFDQLRSRGVELQKPGMKVFPVITTEGEPIYGVDTLRDFILGSDQ